ncbi:MAG TPA: hypothetical protein VM261_30230 [Kofleriaceae bacterium]|nr:hypothetical protein [Kofleriaceae bacterium]
MFGLSIMLLAMAGVFGALGFTGDASGSMGASRTALVVLAVVFAIASMVVYWIRHSRRGELH